jgi:hypothetical protein
MLIIILKGTVLVREIDCKKIRQKRTNLGLKEGRGRISNLKKMKFLAFHAENTLLAYIYLPFFNYY